MHVEILGSPLTTLFRNQGVSVLPGITYVEINFRQVSKELCGLSVHAQPPSPENQSWDDSLAI